MSNKEKHRWRAAGKKNKKKPEHVAFKSKSPKTPLRSKLNQIYNEINLETTCNCQCECCNIAMPQLNYCEYLQLMNDVWMKEDTKGKINIIKTSIEYFFRYDFDKWGKESLIKPCMLLTGEGKCKYYKNRPLSCRMYGLWPEDQYNARVDKFEKAYAGLLTRDELPLNKQCPYVKRVDSSVELTTEVIDSLYKKLDDLDAKFQRFSASQIANKENYRTFHDWFLLTFFGEAWLTAMTDFLLKADIETIKDQLIQIKKVVDEKFSKGVPDLQLV